MISGKFYFQNQPNNLFYGKWFPETIYTQKKWTLSSRMETAYLAEIENFAVDKTKK